MQQKATWGFLGAVALLASCQSPPPTLAGASASEAELLAQALPKGGTLTVRLPLMPSAPDALARAKGKVAARQLASTPTYVARILLTLLQVGQAPRTAEIKRWWSSSSNPAVDFTGVPAGAATLRAEAYDWAGNRLGEVEQAITLGDGQSQVLNLNIPIAGAGDPFASDANQLEAQIVQGNSQRGVMLHQSLVNNQLGNQFYNWGSGIGPTGSGGYLMYQMFCVPGTSICTQYFPGRETLLLSSADGQQSPTLFIDSAGQGIRGSVMGGLSFNPPVLDRARALVLCPLGGAVMEMGSLRILARSNQPLTRSMAFDDDAGILVGGWTSAYRRDSTAPFAESPLPQTGELVAGRPGPGWWSVKDRLEWRLHNAAGDATATGSLTTHAACLVPDGQQGLWILGHGSPYPGFQWSGIPAAARLTHLGPAGQVLSDRDATGVHNISLDKNGQLWTIGPSLDVLRADGSVEESFPISGTGLSADGDELWLRNEQGVSRMAI